MRNQRRTPLLLTALAVATSIPLPAQVIRDSVVMGGPSGQQPVPMITLDPPTGEAPSTTDRIDGIVVSSIDAKPVARVLVTTADRRFAALTDYEGHFSFDLRRPVPDPTPTAPNSFSNPFANANSQAVQFQLRKPGYVTANGVMVYFPTVRPDGPQPPIQLTIQPAATLTGRIEVDSGPLPTNIQIQVRRRAALDGRDTWSNFVANARVDPNGNFRAGDLTPGDYKLQAIAPGVPNAAARNAPASVRAILPAVYPDAPTLDAAASLHIAAGETVNANILLRRGAFYRVTIPLAAYDANRGPRAVLSPNLSGIQLSYNTADHVIAGYLPNGQYEVHLLDTNAGPGRNRNQTEDVACATAHISVSGAPVQTAPITLHPMHEIPVDVADELTGPDSSQEITRRSTYGVNLMPDDQDGFAETKPVPGPPREVTDPQPPIIVTATGGRYHVTFTANGAYAASITSGGMDLLQQPLVIDDNVAPQPIFVTLRNDFATLNLHLASNPATSAPPAAATSLQSTNYALVVPLDRLESQSIGPVGIFAPGSQLAPRYGGLRLPPGHYLVLASSDVQSLQMLAYRDPDTLRTLTAQGATITLTPGEKSDLDVPLLPASSAPGATTQQTIYAGAQ